MINHFRFTEFQDQYLVTNDLGMYVFISKEDFHALTNDNIHRGHPLYETLNQNFFVYDEDQEEFLQRIRDYLRMSKSYLFQGTSLFIFVLTNQCNMHCKYCQANSPESFRKGYMTKETAKRAVDIVFSAPTLHPTIEFQGGEPLLNWETICFITEYAEQKAAETQKDLHLSLVSNLLCMNDDMIEYIKKHNIGVSTSLDGNQRIHDASRQTGDNRGTWNHVIKKINAFHDKNVNIGAIETTTAVSLDKYKEMIDAYVEAGLRSIFIRPLTPLGIAKKRWGEIGYTPEDFNKFYMNSLQYLLKLNKQGVDISEGHAGIFLSKILFSDSVNYMELRSPCGAGIGQIAVNYDGNIYTCDEGRMIAETNDHTFMMGNVYDSYSDLIESDVCKAICAGSLLDSIPECCDCVYHPYCGICPVINYAMEGDIFPRSSNTYRCKIYKGMLNTLFEVLKNNDKTEIEILKRWTAIR